MSNQPAKKANWGRTRLAGFAIPVAVLALLAFVIGFGMKSETKEASAQGPAPTTYVLRHVDYDGDIDPSRDVNNNVRTARHYVCLFDSAVDNAGADGILGDDVTTVGINEAADDIAGAGPVPEGTIGGQALINDQVHFVPDVFVNTLLYHSAADVAALFPSPSAVVDGAGLATECFSWTHPLAGDQELTVTTNAEMIILGGAAAAQVGPAVEVGFDYDGVGGAPRTLIKEWNVLTTSVVTISGAPFTVVGAGTDEVIYTVTVPLYIQPNGTYAVATVVTLEDHFVGSHIMGNGQPSGPLNLSGVVAETDSVGCTTLRVGPNSVDIDPTAGVNLQPRGLGDNASFIALPAPPYLPGDVFPSPIITDEGNAPDIFPAGVVDFVGCTPGLLKGVITFTGNEGNIGSGLGNEVTEIVIFNFTLIPAQKKVLLAWAGQRIILEHDWRIPPGDDIDLNPAAGENGICLASDFGNGVIYTKGGGPGNFVPGLGAIIDLPSTAFVGISTLGPQAIGVLNHGNSDTSQEGDVEAQNPNGACISRVMYESEQPGQVDIEAFVAFCPNQVPCVQGPIISSSKVAFVVFYMTINDVAVSIVDDVSKPDHNASAEDGDLGELLGAIFTGGDAGKGDWSPGNPWDASKDVTTFDSNVSKDVLIRVRVRGWFVNENPSGRPQETVNGVVLPANRWVMPTDWPKLADETATAEGPNGSAAINRPEFDILFAPNILVCLGHPFGIVFENPCNGATDTPTGTTIVLNNAAVIGPYSTIDLADRIAPVIVIDSVPGAALCLGLVGIWTVCDSVIKDGDVDWWDAPMPPSRVIVTTRGAGFIKQVLKWDVYYTGTANTTWTAQDFPNPYYAQNVPASPYIAPIATGGGYNWDSFGPLSIFSNSRPYVFWEPIVAPGTHPETGLTIDTTGAAELAQIRTAYGDPTISRDLTVYTDNHGEAMVAANGDFNLNLTACATNTLGGGKHCKVGDAVGTSTINAIADYPDFRGKHPIVHSNDVTVNWKWGGYKQLTIEDDPAGNNQFKYIVFRALDRDGFCNPITNAVSLHPVLSSVDALFTVGTNDPIENVDFMIDAGEGIILARSDAGSLTGGNNQFANGVLTYSTALRTVGVEFAPLNGALDECQAWVKVSNSLLGILNVLVIAHDDEGDIGFDAIVDFSSTKNYTLTFKWSLITWLGKDGITPVDALKGTGSNEKGNDIFDQVTAVYGWQADAQDWLGFFPDGVAVPGANDLVALKEGQAYWVAIKAPGPVTWTVQTDVDQ